MRKSTVYAFLLLGLFVLVAPMFIMCGQHMAPQDQGFPTMGLLKGSTR